ncbi:MAG: DUF983 domain-containing protein [Sphingobacteriaceae bacterium]
MTQLQAVVQCKCPRCRKGDIYSHSLFSFKYAEMHEFCPKCKIRYELEPGFFWAAMYVSYAFNVAQLVITGFIAAQFLGAEHIWWLIGIVLSPIFVLMPFNFRYSRVILLHFLSPIKYDRSYSK